jgi:hypothetical protein
MLRLQADDAEDLAVISAQMQDAVLKRADMQFDKKRRRFALIANRFAWDALPQRERRRTGLHFDDVTAVKVLGFEAAQASAVLSVLAITFEPKDDLKGEVHISFAAGKQIKLEVDCLNATLDDLGGAWSTEHVPSHDV